jgi:hypothetical protein
MSLTDQQIINLFRVRDRGRPDRLPPPSALTSLLYSVYHEAQGGPIPQTQLTHFITASVEMWHRAVHSFLIAASLYRASELWASVTGYYASHYSIRAFAHLFGFFALHRRRVFLEASFLGGRCQCVPVTGLPKGSRREHRFYWTVVRRQQRFQRDDLFTDNDESRDDTDASHRGYANYVDHINRFGDYNGCDREELRRKVAQIVRTAIDGAISIPDRRRYPDVATVLAVGYLRIRRYRELLDELLGTRGRFWRYHRSPMWSEGLIAFPSE